LSDVTLKGQELKDMDLAAELTGKSSLFKTLILCPEMLLKRSNNFIIWGKVFCGSVIYNKRSSAYNDVLCSLPPLTIPRISGEERIAIARGSIAIANKSGEIGHPCLVPRCNGKDWELVLLVRTDEVGELYSNFTQQINFGPKPNLSIHQNR
jgi:hypothetical protein